MLKFLYTDCIPSSNLDSAWLRDPLSHPDLERMTLEQLADLPFPPVSAQPEPCGAGAGYRPGFLALAFARIRRQRT